MTVEDSAEHDKRVAFRQRQVALATKMLIKLQFKGQRRQAAILLLAHFPEAEAVGAYSRTTMAEFAALQKMTHEGMSFAQAQQNREINKGIRTARYLLRKAYETLIAAKNEEAEHAA